MIIDYHGSSFRPQDNAAINLLKVNVCCLDLLCSEVDVTLFRMCSNHNEIFKYCMAGYIDYHASAVICINTKYESRISINIPSLLTNR